MTEKTFATIAAAIFALVALLHLLRLVIFRASCTAASVAACHGLVGCHRLLDGAHVGELGRPRGRRRPELLRSATRHAQLNGCAVGGGGMGRSLCPPR